MAYSSVRNITMAGLGSKAQTTKYGVKVVDGNAVNLSPEESKAVPPTLLGTVMGKVRSVVYKEEQHPKYGLTKTYSFEGFFEARATDPKIGTLRAPRVFPPFAFGAEMKTSLDNAGEGAELSFIGEVWMHGTGREVPFEYRWKTVGANVNDPFENLRKQAIEAGATQLALEAPTRNVVDAKTGEVEGQVVDAEGEVEDMLAEAVAPVPTPPAPEPEKAHGRKK